MSYSTLASWPLLIWKALEVAGRDPQPVFEHAGIDPELLGRSGARVSESRLERCWIEASRVGGPGCFGLAVARHWHPTTLHALGIACLSSPTLAEAFRRFVRYSTVVTDATDFHFDALGGNYEFTWTFVHDTVSDHREEQHATLATVLHMARLCAGEALAPQRILLPHAPCGCDTGLGEFFGSPLEHRRPAYGLTFASADLDRSLPTANLEMLASSEQVVADYLAGLSRGDLVARARGEVMRQLPSGRTTEESVAGALNMSLRTFQRRLNEHGGAYRDLLDSVRRDLAGKYLANPDYSITEISYLLGFAEPSSFARSFRRWNGTSPSAQRRAAG